MMDAVVSFVASLLKVSWSFVVSRFKASWILIVTPWRLLRQSIHGVYLVGKQARALLARDHPVGLRARLRQGRARQALPRDAGAGVRDVLNGA